MYHLFKFGALKTLFVITITEVAHLCPVTNIVLHILDTQVNASEMETLAGTIEENKHNTYVNTAIIL